MTTQLTERKRSKLFCRNLTLDILPMNNNYSFYILECKDGSKYYGHTNNLVRRFTEHCRGRVQATKNKQPCLAYYEVFNSCSEAFNREMQFKNGKTRKETIEKLLKSFPRAKCQGFNSHSNLCSLPFHKLCAH